MKITPVMLVPFLLGGLAACSKPVDQAGTNIAEAHANAADALDDKADALHNQADQMRQWGKDEKKSVDRAERAGVDVDEQTVNKM